MWNYVIFNDSATTTLRRDTNMLQVASTTKEKKTIIDALFGCHWKENFGVFGGFRGVSEKRSTQKMPLFIHNLPVSFHA